MGMIDVSCIVFFWFYRNTEIKGGEMYERVDIDFGKGWGKKAGRHLRGPPHTLVSLGREHMPCFLG